MIHRLWFIGYDLRRRFSEDWDSLKAIITNSSCIEFENNLIFGFKTDSLVLKYNSNVATSSQQDQDLSLSFKGSRGTLRDKRPPRSMAYPPDSYSRRNSNSRQCSQLRMTIFKIASIMNIYWTQDLREIMKFVTSFISNLGLISAQSILGMKFSIDDFFKFFFKKF